jgi:hypothetical protein
MPLKSGTSQRVMPKTTGKAAQAEMARMEASAKPKGKVKKKKGKRPPPANAMYGGGF